MKVDKSLVRIILTTDDEDKAKEKVDSYFPSKRYDYMKVALWNLNRPDVPVDTKDEWVLFEVIL